jgi:hypothetical protein
MRSITVNANDVECLSSFQQFHSANTVEVTGSSRRTEARRSRCSPFILSRRGNRNAVFLGAVCLTGGFCSDLAGTFGVHLRRTDLATVKNLS